MSHATVLVTRVDEESLEDQLEPFYEQGDEDDYFMEKDYYVERSKESIDVWLKAEKESTQSFIDSEKIAEDGKEYWKNWLKILENISNEKDIDKQIELIREHNGGGEDDKGLYWVSNPNAKWDWWVEGGRWNGWLVKKNGDKVNSCKVKDIDFDGMRKAHLEDCKRWYDEEVKNAKEAGREPMMWNYKEFPTKEQYLKDNDIFPCPHAVLHEGEWQEIGLLGWFGLSDDKMTEEEWGETFKKFIESLDPETEVAIVDYHI